jgi:D-glycero-beta-D-manno-heptose-7-phosphate kinase
MTALTSDRLEEIFARAADLRIAVVGDLMLDEYLSGSVTRISPEAPVPVVQILEHRVALGGAANVAANVIALGSACDVLGYVGIDAAGMEIRKTLAELDGGRTHPRLVERADRPTTTKTRIMARQQQVVRFDREREDDLPDDCVDEIVEMVQDVIEHADAVVLEDYNKGVLVPRVIRTALDGAAGAGIPSVVDPKFRRFFDYRGATVFKPNLLELSTAMASPILVHDARQLEAARERIGCDHLLLTLGEEGMVLCSGAASPYRIAALARDVYDVSGAGDTVTAFVAVALAAGAAMQEAATLANLAAAIEVAKPGVATVSPDEVRQLVQELSVQQAARG